MISRARRLIMLGAGGHASACLDILNENGNHEFLGAVIADGDEKRARRDMRCLGRQSDLGMIVEMLDVDDIVIAIGGIYKRSVRRELFNMVQSKFPHLSLPRVISERAYVSKSATLGKGCFVGHGAIVNSGCYVGCNTIINSCSLLEHDVVVGDHTHVATGALVNGCCSVGKNVFIGSGAIIVEGMNIPDNSFIKAGRLISLSSEFESHD